MNVLKEQYPLHKEINLNKHQPSVEWKLQHNRSGEMKQSSWKSGEEEKTRVKI